MFGRFSDAGFPTAPNAGSERRRSNGETLKATAPAPQSPINNQQPDTLMLVGGKASRTFSAGGAPAYAYEFEVRNSGGSAAVCATAPCPAAAERRCRPPPPARSSSISRTRGAARALFAGAAGPWSANATFRAPAGGYVRGNEVLDPLTNGRTAGDISGPTTFVPGQGSASSIIRAS